VVPVGLERPEFQPGPLDRQNHRLQPFLAAPGIQRGQLAPLLPMDQSLRLVRLTPLFQLILECPASPLHPRGQLHPRLQLGQSDQEARRHQFDRFALAAQLALSDQLLPMVS
jgi:hypothetical protein